VATDAPEPDGPLSQEQEAIAASLSDEDVAWIDGKLMEQACEEWRKVARVVGTAMSETLHKYPGLPDVYYAQRIKALVAAGKLDSDGDLNIMGRSEVRQSQRGQTNET